MCIDYWVARCPYMIYQITDVICEAKQIVLLKLSLNNLITPEI